MSTSTSLGVANVHTFAATETKPENKKADQNFGLGDIVSFPIDYTFKNDKYINTAIKRGFLEDNTLAYGIIEGFDKKNEIIMVTTPMGILEIDKEKTAISKAEPLDAKIFEKVYQSIKQELDKEIKPENKKADQNFGLGDIVSFPIESTIIDKYINAAYERGLLPDKSIHGTVTGISNNFLIVTSPTFNIAVDPADKQISKSTPNELREFSNVINKVKKELDFFNKSNENKKTVESPKIPKAKTKQNAINM